MNPLKQLVHEIHGRSLWQVLGSYAAFGWVVLQVVDTASGALEAYQRMVDQWADGDERGQRRVQEMQVRIDALGG